MTTSSAGKFAFKPRGELDVLIEKFEHDVTDKLEELTEHFTAYADIILSMTGADDDQYVCNRLNSILQERGLLRDSPSPEAQ